jgi:hypothetical protein
MGERLATLGRTVELVRDTTGVESQPLFREYASSAPFCCVRCGSMVKVLMSALLNEYPAKNSFLG